MNREELTRQSVAAVHVPYRTDSLSVFPRHAERVTAPSAITPGSSAQRQQAHETATSEPVPALAGVTASAASGTSGSSKHEKLIHVLETGPLRVAVQCAVRVGEASWLEVVVSLERGADLLRFDCVAEWHERHQLLKAEFPFEIMPAQGVASFEIQYGYAARANHSNTSWDEARYEVCAQRWADCSEHGFGCSLLNDCKHGHSVLGSTMSLSLLRAPKTPDPTADMGHHVFSYALRPHAGSALDAHTLRAAVAFNTPLRLSSSTHSMGSTSAALSARPLPPACFFWVEGHDSCSGNSRDESAITTATAAIASAIILDAVKLAEDGSGDVILRLYEAHGGRATATVRTASLFKRAYRTNLMEEPFDGAAAGVSASLDASVTPQLGTSLQLTLRPFEVATLRLSPTSVGNGGVDNGAVRVEGGKL